MKQNSFTDIFQQHFKFPPCFDLSPPYQILRSLPHVCNTCGKPWGVTAGVTPKNLGSFASIAVLSKNLYLPFWYIYSICIGFYNSNHNDNDDDNNNDNSYYNISNISCSSSNSNSNNSNNYYPRIPVENFLKYCWDLMHCLKQSLLGESVDLFELVWTNVGPIFQFQTKCIYISSGLFVILSLDFYLLEDTKSSMHGQNEFKLLHCTEVCKEVETNLFSYTKASV